MTITSTTSTSDGVTPTFSVPFPYLSREDVDVLTDGAPYSGVVTWINGALLSLSPVPVAGTDVTRRRLTDDAEPRASFTNANISATGLNANHTQALYRLQELAEGLGRTLTMPYGEDGLTLPSLDDLKGNVLGFDPVTGAPIAVDVSEGGDLLTTALTRLFLTTGLATYVLFQQNGVDAAVRTAMDKMRERVSIMDFINAGDEDLGSNAAKSASYALQRAVNTGKPVFLPSGNYRLTARVVPPTGVDLDIRGDAATIEIVGNSDGLTTGFPVTASSTISAGATLGSDVVTVVDASLMNGGGWVSITADNQPADNILQYPKIWRKVVRKVGSDLVLDRPLSNVFKGTISIDFYATLRKRCRIEDVRFTGPTCTYTAGLGASIRLQGFEELTLKSCRWEDWTLNNVIAQLINCPVMRVEGCDWKGIITQSNCLAMEGANTGFLSMNTIKCQGFGANVTKIEAAITMGNHFVGNRKREIADALGSFSIRGLKVTGCPSWVSTNDVMENFDSCFRAEAFWNVQLNNAVARHGDGGVGVGSTANMTVNISSANTTVARSVIINGLQAENCAGGAIGVSGFTDGRCVITNFDIRETGWFGMYLPIPKVTVGDGRIENWGRTTSGEAIYTNNGYTLHDISIRNTDAAQPVLRTALPVSSMYSVRGITRETGNPLYTGGLDVQSRGAITVPSGTSSVTYNHLLLRTPTADEIRITATNSSAITNPTGAPWRIHSITATQFTVSFADPGASGWTGFWTAELRMPFST